MASSTPGILGHGALMDGIYRRQKHIYDATRKYFLFGRDRMIANLGCKPGMRVLEVGCGTGRNLALIGKRWPGVRLYGIDISQEMLSIADERLGASAKLALGDATCFESEALLGEPGFDRIVISFAVSMIPRWQDAIDHAAGLLAPGGTLHVVDFGDFSGIPAPLRALLSAWLRWFHVTPRQSLPACAAELARERKLGLSIERGPLGYFRLVTIG